MYAFCRWDATTYSSQKASCPLDWTGLFGLKQWGTFIKQYNADRGHSECTLWWAWPTEQTIKHLSLQTKQESELKNSVSLIALNACVSLTVHRKTGKEKPCSHRFEWTKHYPQVRSQQMNLSLLPPLSLQGSSAHVLSISISDRLPLTHARKHLNSFVLYVADVVLTLWFCVRNA